MRLENMVLPFRRVGWLLPTTAAAAERESESIWGPGPFSPVPKVATHFRWAERIVAYAGLFLRFQFVLRSTTAQRIRLQFS